ncbi:MAG: hypothetical protein U5N26_02190 [Candidatus Marinimicrobia bacterium]|nr:hypothetical protein [Candidatus Neomarinimicrobiota bacterium]
MKQKRRLFTGLAVLLLFSFMTGENNDYSPKFTFRYQPPGVMPALPSSPSGFTRAWETPYNPLSANFPGMFSMIKTVEATGDSGKVMLLYESIGDDALNLPRYIPFDSYFRERTRHDISDLWYQKVAMTDSLYHKDPMQQQSGGSLEIIGADIAGQRVALRIRGLISITGKYNQQNNSIMATGNMENEQKNFLMDQTQQFTIEGTIGDRITISIDEDSERDFEFENAIKVDYRGKEDEIVQRANFGNIGLSLPGHALSPVRLPPADSSAGKPS